MKGMIKLASLAAVTLMLTGCCGWDSWNCNNPCERSCEPRCCPAPHIWNDNNSYEQESY